MSLRDNILVLLLEKGELSSQEIAEVLQKDIREVDETLRALVREGLVVEKEKGLLFKKRVYDLTASGVEEAKKAKEALEEKAKKVEEAIINGDYNALQSFMPDIPLMMALSLIDAMLLEQLMHYMTVEALTTFDEPSDVADDSDSF